MTGNVFNSGLSALLASQRGLATTGHNIANVNTESYSRQRVLLESRDPQFVGVGFVGKGVDVQSIRRLTNEFLVAQVRQTSSSHVNADKLLELSDQVDRQIGEGLVTDGIRNVFSAIGDANDDPRLIAPRQVVLENSESLVARFVEGATS